MQLAISSLEWNVIIQLVKYDIITP
jgi:hypothetical protein